MDVCNNLELIRQGAEGRLFKTEYIGKIAIVKERFKKSYRHPMLDEQILKDRMKAEARGLLRSKVAGVSTPTVYLVDLECRKLYMEYIEGSTVKEYIDSIELSSDGKLQINSSDAMDLTNKIGSAIGKIHNVNLIHGDLTTSNMLVNKNGTGSLCLIDFGLSYVSTSAEDKGVDLYVLERGLASTHPSSELLFENIISSYKTTLKSSSQEILRKYEEVKARGRKRTMVG